MSETTTTTPAPKSEAVTLKDKRGRSIIIKPVSAREQFHLMKFLGGNNDTYMGMAIMAASVRNVEDSPIPGPFDGRGVDLIFAELGDDGWEAVQEHYASLAKQASADTVMAEAKN